MSRPALQISLIAGALLALALPAAAKTVHPAPAPPPPYRLHPLKGDAFTTPTVLGSDFGGDYARLAYVPAAESDQAAQALLAAIPPAAEQELAFAYGGRTLRYFVVGDTSKPARMIVVFVHGLGDDRSQGMTETRFGGNFARLKRLVADNEAIYLSPDFSGFGREAEDEIAALIADYAGRAPDAPVFVACMSYGGSLCWRLAEDAGATSPLRGILVFAAPVDRAFLPHMATGQLPVYLGIGTKDYFASWKSADAFFKDAKTAAPTYPIRLAIFDAGEHGTAIRLTDWVEVLNWMLAAIDGEAAPAAAAAVAAGPPCPRPRPTAGGHPPLSYCGNQ